MRSTITSLLLAGVALIGVGASASAQGRHHPYTYAANDLSSLPLTVNRRSWLDPGNSAPTGGSSGPAYVSASTQFAGSPDHVYAPDKFGNSALQGQPYVPGRTVPVVSFVTTPNGAGYVEDVLHYQPD
jgi:hypothetical protein